MLPFSKLEGELAKEGLSPRVVHGHLLRVEGGHALGAVAGVGVSALPRLPTVERASVSSAPRKRPADSWQRRQRGRLLGNGRSARHAQQTHN